MISVTIPGEAPSTPNLREHWAVKAKRMKAQRAAVARRMPAWSEGPLLIVRLTRVAPRALDTDNLAAALKGHRDAVAARLRVDDASLLVRWEYHQAKGEPAVVVQAWRAGQQAPEVAGTKSLRTPFKVESNLKLGSNSAPRVVPGLGAEVMREMLKPPGGEDYRAVVGRALLAAQQAEETFAPPMCPLPGCPNEHPCMRHGLHVLGRKP